MKSDRDGLLYSDRTDLVITSGGERNGSQGRQGDVVWKLLSLVLEVIRTLSELISLLV